MKKRWLLVAGRNSVRRESDIVCRATDRADNANVRWRTTAAAAAAAATSRQELRRFAIF